MLVKYLLGELNEQELESIEDHYFRDIEFFEQLLVVEDELIDAYVRGELTIEEIARFEDYFLQSPERRDKVQFAEAWQAFIARQAESSKPQPVEQPQPVIKQRKVLLPLAASLIMALGVTWLLIDRRNLERELDRAQSELAQSKERIAEQKSSNEPLSRVPAQEPANAIAPPPKQAPRPRPSIVTFALSSSSTRGSGENESLIIPSGAKKVRLRADFFHYDYTRFSAVLRRSNEEVNRWTDLKPRISGDTGTIVLTLNAGSLSDDDYILTVSGATESGEEEGIEDYAFRVVKK